MTEHKIDIEAESLEEAKEKVRSQIPEGLFLLSEHVISDGKPKSLTTIADTLDAAHKNAHQRVPPNATIIHEKELYSPAHYAITITAFDESKGESEAKERVRIKWGAVAAVKGFELKNRGKRGFFGIGRTPNQYEADVFQQAVVEITYKEKALIRANYGEQPEDRKIYGTDLRELRDLLRRQNGVLHCIQCNSEVQLDLKTIEDAIRKNKQIAARLGGNAVLFHPDISEGTVCKSCRGVVCGKCSHNALSRKMEFQNYLEPLIRKHLLGQLGLAALMNPELIEESLRKILPLILSPADTSTIMCLKCKRELLMGIDHITD